MRKHKYGAQATEHQEQASLIEWCNYMKGQHPELALIFAIPNGGDRHPAVAAKLKAEGVKPGVPDLCLPVARKGCHGLFIEMKVGRNRLTAAQEKWAVDLDEQEYRWAVCYGQDEAQKVILDYLTPHEGA